MTQPPSTTGNVAATKKKPDAVPNSDVVGCVGSHRPFLTESNYETHNLDGPLLLLGRVTHRPVSRTKMRTHQDAKELALACARNARLASTKAVSLELWRMALEYQAEAAKLNNGRKPYLGEPPLWLNE
jgi:hypothetical protein